MPYKFACTFIAKVQTVFERFWISNTLNQLDLKLSEKLQTKLFDWEKHFMWIVNCFNEIIRWIRIRKWWFFASNSVFGWKVPNLKMYTALKFSFLSNIRFSKPSNYIANGFQVLACLIQNKWNYCAKSTRILLVLLTLSTNVSSEAFWPYQW